MSQPAPLQLGDHKIKLHDGSKVTLSTLNNKIKRITMYAHQTIIKRLSQKYCIDCNLAEIWLDEFYKYLIILCYLEDLGKYQILPSAAMEKVWRTHSEFTYVHRELMKECFGEVVECPSWTSKTSDTNKSIKTVSF